MQEKVVFFFEKPDSIQRNTKKKNTRIETERAGRHNRIGPNDIRDNIRCDGRDGRTVRTRREDSEDDPRRRPSLQKR